MYGQMLKMGYGLGSVAWGCAPAAGTALQPAGEADSGHLSNNFCLNLRLFSVRRHKVACPPSGWQAWLLNLCNKSKKKK